MLFLFFFRYHKNGQSLLVLLPSEEPEMLKVTSTFRYYSGEDKHIQTVTLRKKGVQFFFIDYFIVSLAC